MVWSSHRHFTPCGEGRGGGKDQLAGAGTFCMIAAGPGVAAIGPIRLAPEKKRPRTSHDFRGESLEIVQ
ncbi:MAG: hypothetical protein NT176_18050 [Proteobacteria bacterium]|nr:hypothetical protein [Pseudomonadota bacterium]